MITMAGELDRWRENLERLSMERTDFGVSTFCFEA